MWNLKSNTKKKGGGRFRDAENSLVVSKGGLMWAKQVEVVKRYKLAVLKWIPWRCNVQHGDYNEFCIIYFKVGKKNSPYSKKIVMIYGDGYY